jgi:hypothetical protein
MAGNIYQENPLMTTFTAEELEEAGWSFCSWELTMVKFDNANEVVHSYSLKTVVPKLFQWMNVSKSIILLNILQAFVDWQLDRPMSRAKAREKYFGWRVQRPKGSETGHGRGSGQIFNSWSGPS